MDYDDFNEDDDRMSKEIKDKNADKGSEENEQSLSYFEYSLCS
jgi:hypothetical protein